MAVGEDRCRSRTWRVMVLAQRVIKDLWSGMEVTGARSEERGTMESRGWRRQGQLGGH